MDKVPSTAAKKRFAAKLRKIRWRIYRDIDLKRGNIVKSLKYYKRQVRLFLKEFSKKLKAEEPSIWNEKVSKTSDDVHTSKRNKKKAQVCTSCSAKFHSSIGASLLSLSAAYHFIRTNGTALNKVEKVNEENLDDKAMAAELEDEESSHEGPASLGIFLPDGCSPPKEVTGDDIVATVQKESRLASFWENGYSNPVPADQAEELLKAFSREASPHVSKKGYVVMNARNDGEVIAEEGITADDDENDKSTAAAVTIKQEITASSSKPAMLKPVDWSKCLK